MQTEETFLKKRSELSAAKQALLDKRLRQENIKTEPLLPGAVLTPAIPQRPVEVAAPLSFTQKRLWFLQQLEPESYAYNEPIAVYLRGPLNVEALIATAREITHRHEILRSTFPMVDGQVVQVIDANAHLDITLPIIDLQGIPQTERDAEVKRHIARLTQTPFNLNDELPWRSFLLRLDEQEHISLTIMHHIITDAWSNEVFVREIGILYSAFNAGQPSSLPALSIQYADYAYWQQQLLEQGTLEAQLAYWKEQLKDALPVLELPTDRPHPLAQTYQGKRLPLTISRPVTQALQAFSRQEGVTLFMTLLTAFDVLLYRYANQEDILIGSPIAGRTKPELEELLGCFVNTLVFRSNLAGNPTFKELLGRVREVALEAYAHQDLPFERLVEELQPTRSLSHTPLFQVMFSLQNVPLAEQNLSGLTITPVEVENVTSKFDLSLDLQETATQELQGYLEFNTDLFDLQTIERFSTHFQLVLAAMVADPGQHIANFSILSETEYQQQVIDWNVTTREFVLDQCYPQLFEAQVERTPDAVAVIASGKQLTYLELNQQANRLAYQLKDLGVGPDVLVGVLAERGIPLLTAILAIFKAGGTYLPLDPHHPASRMRQVLTHSASPLLLVEPTFNALLEKVFEEFAGESRPVVRSLETAQNEETSSIAVLANLLPTNNPQHLAYIIYTSGSTGTPKGVMVKQIGMVNHIQAKIDALSLTSADCVAQIASQCFDISIWQFLAALLVGGNVHILSDEVVHDPVQLLNQLDQQEITILETVPSLLRLMVEASGSANANKPALQKMRWLIPTGEALPPDLTRSWLGLYPGIPLLNAYGPTECSDEVTHHEIPFPLAETVTNTPIGRPIPNLRLYILNNQLQPMPVGVSGELYAGGVGVGRGYLKDPVRTAESFVPDPFSSDEGARIYKTGDLARYLPDGSIEFLGRIDHQVKVRGYRIELGEIEAILNQHPAVSKSVVLVREDIPGDKRLVAYVVMDQTRLPRRGEVHDYLLERLPEYMVPNTFVVLEALPITSNGKLDRKALTAPSESETTLEVTKYIAPRNALEVELARIWAEVLGQSRVGINDNFFEVGGHSLLIAQVIARVRETFQVDLPFKVLFRSPTVAGLAESIERVKVRADELRKPSVTPVSRDAYRIKRTSLNGGQAETIASTSTSSLK